MVKFSHSYISDISLEMAMLLHGGVGSEECLYLLLEDETDKRIKKVYENMAQVLAEGNSLSQAMKESHAFPEYVCQMVETGEQTGRLEQAFRSLSAYYLQQTQLTEEVRSALAYPSMLFIMMLMIIGVLLIKVLPVFNEVYQQLGGTMDGMAAVLLVWGQRLAKCLPIIGGILILILIFSVVILASSNVRTKLASVWCDHFGSRGILARISTVRFTEAMAMSMMSGLNMEQAFSLAMQFSFGGKKVRQHYQACLQQLEQGEPMAVCFRENRILPPNLCRILELGIRSGTVDEAMKEIASRLNESTQRQLQKKVGAIEPAIVIVTSILVGIILLAVMMPLINIMTTLGF